MSAQHKPYSKRKEYWCEVCGNEWHENHIGECWERCEGCRLYVKMFNKNFYFEDTEDEGYYCKACYLEKKAVQEELAEGAIPDVKEPDLTVSTPVLSKDK